MSGELETVVVIVRTIQSQRIQPDPWLTGPSVDPYVPALASALVALTNQAFLNAGAAGYADDGIVVRVEQPFMPSSINTCSLEVELQPSSRHNRDCARAMHKVLSAWLREHETLVLGDRHSPFQVRLIVGDAGLDFSPFKEDALCRRRF